MAPPAARFRQSLLALGLINVHHASFDKVTDSLRKASADYSMCDSLGAASAMFSLEYPSMLLLDPQDYWL